MNEDVYIVFDDEPRSDGSNIHGVFKNLSSAEQQLEICKLRKPWIDYHIEVFGLWD